MAPTHQICIQAPDAGCGRGAGGTAVAGTITVTLSTRLRRGALPFLYVANWLRAQLGCRTVWVPRWVISVKVVRHAA